LLSDNALLVAVSAYVTHGVFPNYTWQRFKADKGGAQELGA
jgi:hypothetical protein